MSSFAEQLAQLKREYLAGLPEIGNQLRAFMADPKPGPEAIEAIQGEVHRLAGNAGAFQQMTISQLAARLEARLSKLTSGDQFSAQIRADFDALIEMLENRDD